MSKSKNTTAPVEVEESKEVAVSSGSTSLVPGSETLLQVSPADLFKSSSTVVVGTNYKRLILNEGETSPWLQYVRNGELPMDKETVDTDTGELKTAKELVTLQIARDPAGNLYSLPIAAIFQKNWKSADVKKGEWFAVQRGTDTVKAKGLGKGNKMETYSIAFPNRTAVD